MGNSENQFIDAHVKLGGAIATKLTVQNDYNFGSGWFLALSRPVPICSQIGGGMDEWWPSADSYF